MNAPGDPVSKPGAALKDVVCAFALENGIGEDIGEFLEAEPYGNGHIHDTYRVFFAPAGSPARMIVQRINTQVFREPHLLMENVARVTVHLAAQVAGSPDGDRRALALIPTRTGGVLHTDAEGNLWRAFRFIPNTCFRDQIESPAQAFEAARAFGLFQHQLATLPPPPLHATIPGFHHTPKRYAAFEEAVARDAAGRAGAAQAEIAFARERKWIAGLLIEPGTGKSSLPERVTHNDTKINNVLFDERTGAGLCVIDLDTVMPGLAAYDFGDMVRTMTCAAPEDETDLARVTVDLSLFEAVARGYWSAAGAFLTPAEKDSLAIAGKLITYELALRFLTDYLNGDTYFKIHRPAHNLDRCRAQFALVASLEENEPALARLLRSIV